MPGRKSMRRVQWGRETVAGVAVPATAIWRGPANTHDDQREIVNPEEQTGFFSGTDRTYYPKAMSVLPLAETEATFEQLQYLFVMSFAPDKYVGSAQGVSGSTVVFENPVPTRLAPALVQPYTVESGDDFLSQFTTYSLCRQISFTGNAGAALRVSAELFGRDVGTMNGGSFTNSATLREVEEILVSRGSLFLDAISGAYMTTRIATQILGFDMNITPVWEPKFTMDGGTFFSYAVLTRVDITGQIRFEHDLAGTAEMYNWRNNVPRLLGVNYVGGTIPNGITFTNKTFQVKLPIRWQKFGPLTDQNGNDILTGDFISRFNVTAQNAGTFLIAYDKTITGGGSLLP